MSSFSLVESRLNFKESSNNLLLERLLPALELLLQENDYQLDEKHDEKHYLKLINLYVERKFGSDVKSGLMKYVLRTYNSMSNGESSDVEVQNMTQRLAFMHRLNWTSLYKKQYMSAINSIIAKKMNDVCDGTFGEPIFDELQQWLESDLQPFMRLLFIFSQDLSYSLVDLFSKIRSKELFDMVTDYPDSIPALQELKMYTVKSDNMGFVGQQFRSTLVRRLLHMGATTSQILDFYVSMIKALRVIDPSDLLLHYVAEPVRKYLKSRKDAVRCIISSLIEGGDSDLHHELRRGGGSLEYGVDEDDEEAGPGASWEPRKRDRNLNEVASNVGSRGLDILALLVSIYGSTDLFIREYRMLLADKLLSNLTYFTDQEVTNLELLKLRFGEEPLHSCEVMLKDIEDSKRTNAAIVFASSSTKTEQDIDIDFAIISENYWPTVDMDRFLYHPKIQSDIERYRAAYTTLKKPRNVHPIPTLGQVELDLSFEDGTNRTFMVTPLQASLIMHFNEVEKASGPLTCSRLCILCELEEEDVQTGLTFWINKGVLREVSGGTGGYEVRESQGLRGDVLRESDLHDTDGAAMRMQAADGSQRKATLTKVETYVKGMLTSTGSMTVERVHTMLKLLVGGGGGGDVVYDLNPVQLQQFLLSMVEQNQLEFMDGVFSIKT